MQTAIDQASLQPICLVGYSGHGFVAADILQASGQVIAGYADREEKATNPFHLPYLGPETSLKADQLAAYRFFIAIGDNGIRHRVYTHLAGQGASFASAVHPAAVVAATVQASAAVFIAAGAVLNPMVELGTGAIINTRASIDHECVVGAFAHIGPGAVLCGNVKVGAFTFVGAGSIVKQGVRIGANSMIGAGSLVLNDLPDNCLAFGQPARPVKTF